MRHVGAGAGTRLQLNMTIALDDVFEDAFTHAADSEEAPSVKPIVLRRSEWGNDNAQNAFSSPTDCDVDFSGLLLGFLYLRAPASSPLHYDDPRMSRILACS